MQLAGLLDEDPLRIATSLSSTIQQSTFWRKQRSKENVQLINTNVSPAIAVSWDPWSDNKTRVAFTARRYYDKVFLNVPLIELEPLTTDLVYSTTRIPGTVADFGVPRLTSSINPAVNVASVGRDLSTPYQDEFTFSFEREIAAETSVGISYINRKYRDQFQDTDINHLPADLGRCVRPSDFYPFYVQPVQPGDPDYDERFAPGDGLLDDCAGEIVEQPCTAEGCPDPLLSVEVPDGTPDLYLQNPGWGDIYEVGNLNSIDYEAYVLSLTRRQYRNWEMQLSYTWSQTIGDGEDFDQLLGDDRSLQSDERGFQSYDQRHAVKLNATTITPWGIRLGTAISWESGLPYSLLQQELAFHQVPPQYRNLGTSQCGTRTPEIPDGPAQRPAQRVVLERRPQSRQGGQPRPAAQHAGFGRGVQPTQRWYLCHLEPFDRHGAADQRQQHGVPPLRPPLAARPQDGFLETRSNNETVRSPDRRRAAVRGLLVVDPARGGGDGALQTRAPDQPEAGAAAHRGGAQHVGQDPPARPRCAPTSPAWG